MSLYRQCKMTKGDLTQTSWLPEPFGRVGRLIRLRQRGGVWDDGWTVIEAGEAVEDPPDFRSHLVCCPELRRSGPAG